MFLHLPLSRPIPQPPLWTNPDPDALGPMNFDAFSRALRIHYPHHVLLPSVIEVDQMVECRHWCEDQYESRNACQLDEGFYLLHLKQRWASSFSNFYFTSQTDAAAFKIRWY